MCQIYNALHFIISQTLSSNEVSVMINEGVCRGEVERMHLQGYCQEVMNKGFFIINLELTLGKKSVAVRSMTSSVLFCYLHKNCVVFLSKGNP